MRGGWHKWCSGMSTTTTMNTTITTTTFTSPEFVPFSLYCAPQNPARPADSDCTQLTRLAYFTLRSTAEVLQWTQDIGENGGSWEGFFSSTRRISISVKEDGCVTHKKKTLCANRTVIGNHGRIIAGSAI